MGTTVMEVLVLKLTRIRQEKRWSLGELARRARMAPADVGKIEAGRLIPYESQLRKLARALGIGSEDSHRLLEDANAPTPEQPEASSAPVGNRGDVREGSADLFITNAEAGPAPQGQSHR